MSHLLVVKQIKEFKSVGPDGLCAISREIGESFGRACEKAGVIEASGAERNSVSASEPGGEG